MLRHEFQPGKLVGGFFLTAAGVIYLGDAGGAWETPWFVVLPLTFGGLCLAGAVAFVHHALRGNRASGRTGGGGPAEAAERTDPPGGTRAAGAAGAGAGPAGRIPGDGRAAGGDGGGGSGGV